MIYIKTHKTDDGDMVAMCDEQLINKVLIQGDVEINIKDYSDFYKGELVSKTKAAKMLDPERIHSANIIGKESIEAAIEGGIVLEESVKIVSRIPYAYTFRIKY